MDRSDPNPPPAGSPGRSPDTSTDTYTHGHDPSVLRSHTWRTVENSAAYLVPHLRPGSSLLDVGCGPGTITADLAERLAPGSVVGIDSAARIIDQARAANPLDNLRFNVDDCYHLSFSDYSFDIVHARLDRWMALYQAVARRNRGEPDAGRQLLAWSREAGYEAVTPSASAWCFATADERRWWGELWSQRVQESALAVQAIEYGLAGRAELAELGQIWIDWSEHPDAWFVVVNGEVILRP